MSELEESAAIEREYLEAKIMTAPTSREELLELADQYEAGLAKMEACGYEEMAPMIEQHQVVIAALRYQAAGLAQGRVSLSDFTDAEIAREHGWRMQRALGDPRICVGTEFTPDTLVSSTTRCANCGCETKGEAALVNGAVWCHPCADYAPMTSKHGASE
jgi:hypothetical protein